MGNSFKASQVLSLIIETENLPRAMLTAIYCSINPSKIFQNFLEENTLVTMRDTILPVCSLLNSLNSTSAQNTFDTLRVTVKKCGADILILFWTKRLKIGKKNLKTFRMSELQMMGSDN